jgi:hypothetical protein
MPNDAITPAEVYERVVELDAVVRRLIWFVGALCLLVILKTIINLSISVNVLKMLRRVEKLLDLSERHGTLTDDKLRDLKTETARATNTVVGAVEVAAKTVTAIVPPKVVAEIKRDVESGLFKKPNPEPGSI